MRGLALAVTVLVTQAALAGCGQETGTATTTSAPTGRPSQQAAGLGGNRFQDLYRESNVIFRQTGETHTGPDPKDADDANRLLGLGDSSPLRFADLEDLHGDRGRFCLVSDDETYVALDVGRTVTVLFGDGSCSYSAHDAAVVGDVFRARWTRGADLMGHLSVRKLFEDRLSVEGDESAPPPSSSAPTQPQGQADPQLLAEARTLAFSIDGYALSEGHYPMVEAADLVRTVAGGLTVGIGPHTSVVSYRATAGRYAMCLADDTGWVRWDGTRRGDDVSKSATDSGTYSSPAELDRSCATPTRP